MLNKKMKIIIFCALAVVIFASIAFFLIKNREKNILSEIKDEKVQTNIAELRINNPQLSEKKINYYAKIAVGEDKKVFDCLGRRDEKDCIASVAFIKEDEDICYIHGHDNDEHEEENEGSALMRCVNDVLKNNSDKEVAGCKEKKGDDLYNCLNNLFDIYDKKEDCSELIDEDSRIVCEELFDYKYAYSKYDRNLCDGVVDNQLNKYCLMTIIDKSQDTDGDGLNDLDEINKYKTHYLLKDTDGDGISDGDEMKK